MTKKAGLRKHREPSNILRGGSYTNHAFLHIGRLRPDSKRRYFGFRLTINLGTKDGRHSTSSSW